jgi:predicted secreted protein
MDVYNFSLNTCVNITLSSNRTTGYQWYIKSINNIDNNYLENDKINFGSLTIKKIYISLPNPDNLLGLGGNDIFYFLCNSDKNKTYIIKLLYMRTENDVVGDKTIKVSFS